MRISDVAFRGFPPFADGEMTFPHTEYKDGETKYGEVHFLTGQNGTGKTRLLSLLAAALGNPKELMDRVGPNKTGSFVRFLANNKEAIFGPANRSNADSDKVLGINNQINSTAWNNFITSEKDFSQFGYSHFSSSVQDWDAAKNALLLAYRGTVRAKDADILAMNKLDFGNPINHLLLERDKSEDTLICQSMANLKLSAAMESQGELPPEQQRATIITKRMEKTVAEMTGRKFSFVVKRSPSVHLTVNWGGTSMRIGELPDGLRSLIGWLISCVAKLDAKFPDNASPLDLPMILLLDEPESHLHPAWQRKLIPAAQMLFPNSQMFIATHSPFVISSVNHNGWIHILKADGKGVVHPMEGRPCSAGDTYLDVVEEVLGLTEWYDPETEMMLREFQDSRKAVINGLIGIDELQSKAEAIGSRSESLSNMMGKEMHQLKRQLASRVIAS